jgi:hypothetical protein
MRVWISSLSYCTNINGKSEDEGTFLVMEHNHQRKKALDFE